MVKKAEQVGELVQTNETYVAKDITVVNRDPMSIEDKKARLRALEAWDMVPVKGVFRRHDQNPDPIEFTIRKYASEKPANTRYRMEHGKVYTIPRHVAKHLSEQCATPIYGSDNAIQASLIDKNAQNIVGWNHRFSFSSLDFSSSILPEGLQLAQPHNQQLIVR